MTTPHRRPLENLNENANDPHTPTPSRFLKIATEATPHPSVQRILGLWKLEESQLADKGAEADGENSDDVKDEDVKDEDVKDQGLLVKENNLAPAPHAIPPSTDVTSTATGRVRRAGERIVNPYKEEHKALYDEAKEKLELLAHGGLEMTGRGKKGTAGPTNSGYRYSFRCTHWDKDDDTTCQAQGFINADFTFEMKSRHTAPTKDPANGDVDVSGTGCARYGHFRGLHASEVAVGVKHDTHAARTTRSKDLSLKILAQKVADKQTLATSKVEGDREENETDEVHFEKAPPTRRAICRWLAANKGHEHVDIADIGTCQGWVEKYWADKQSTQDNPIPCDVRVVFTDQWESSAKVPAEVKTEDIAPASRKSAKTATKTKPSASDDTHRETCNKKAAPQTVMNSIIILSTYVLMAICKAGQHASVDGTYRCAPGRSTIADFGVFSGRAYIPCFLGILTGPRSGDTSEHWGRFMAAVKTLLGGWSPHFSSRVMPDQRLEHGVGALCSNSMLLPPPAVLAPSEKDHAAACNQLQGDHAARRCVTLHCGRKLRRRTLGYRPQATGGFQTVFLPKDRPRRGPP